MVGVSWFRRGRRGEPGPRVRGLLLFFVGLLMGGSPEIGWGKQFGQVAYAEMSSVRRMYQLGAPVYLTGAQARGASAVPARLKEEINPRLKATEYFQMSSPRGPWIFRVNSQIAYYDGLRHWLSFPVLRDERGEVFISDVDRRKLLEPLLKPQHVLKKRRVAGVVLDAGHGGHDRGAASRQGLWEKEANLDTARRVKRQLERMGIPVVMTRSKDVFIPLHERSNMASRYRNHIFVSIHHNAGSSRAYGVETYAMSPAGTASTGAARSSPRLSDNQAWPGNSHDAENLLLAEAIQRQIAQFHDQGGDRGVKRARFAVLRRTAIPAVLVECGFLSHQYEAARLAKGDYRERMARAIASGIQRYVQTVEGRSGEGAPAPLIAEEPMEDVPGSAPSKIAVVKPVDVGSETQPTSEPQIKLLAGQTEERPELTPIPVSSPQLVMITLPEVTLPEDLEHAAEAPEEIDHPELELVDAGAAAGSRVKGPGEVAFKISVRPAPLRGGGVPAPAPPHETPTAEAHAE